MVDLEREGASLLPSLAQLTSLSSSSSSSSRAKGDNFEEWDDDGDRDVDDARIKEGCPKDCHLKQLHLGSAQGCQMAKFDPLLSLGCAPPALHPGKGRENILQ